MRGRIDAYIPSILPSLHQMCHFFRSVLSGLSRTDAASSDHIVLPYNPFLFNVTILFPFLMVPVRRRGRRFRAAPPLLLLRISLWLFTQWFHRSSARGRSGPTDVRCFLFPFQRSNNIPGVIKPRLTLIESLTLPHHSWTFSSSPRTAAQCRPPGSGHRERSGKRSRWERFR